MRKSISNRFLINYVLMFFISALIAVFSLMLLDFSNHTISKNLVKNNFKAEDLMKNNYKEIDMDGVIKNGGGIQVINSDYEMVFSKGLDTISKQKLTVQEFTDFLMQSKSKGVEYSYSIKYNQKEKFWLIVTFPTSFRIDFAIAHNTKYTSADTDDVAGVIIAILIFYFLMLAITTIIYSKISSIGIINPLKKLSSSVKRFKNGDYSARVELNLKNEFAEIQDTFNAMASQVEQEISLRKQSEENRKKLILDISHDIKNPLASIMGYAEHLNNRPDMPLDERVSCTRIIYENSIRANNLITEMFELSKLESPEFRINTTRVDICEFLREEMGSFIPLLDNAGLTYDFEIPEKEIYSMMDTVQMKRVFHNLVANAVKYNPKGTEMALIVFEQAEQAVIVLKDNGIGIPEALAKDIFLPFVRADNSRNSQTGGTGLGLAIAEKIIKAHGGSINLTTGEGLGCEFTIKIPRIK